ncbi:predicted protein [Nematostella vectensis]|uniref:RING-CH-type domain-containing protein n=1 Tax=Nematostella vectensis TaxID=45351 RepID=A7SXB2_NEMVE|nr:predicted protein [Nematostella vectensis]|eukprot:XP_001623742.1 predicted protein [Nematostella vectensis]
MGVTMGVYCDVAFQRNRQNSHFFVSSNGKLYSKTIFKRQYIENTMTHLDAIDDPFMTTIGLEDDEPMCRICQNTVQRMIGKEELIKPCLCNGTLGYAHRSCMEQWLTLTEKKKCTICEFTFKTKTVLKPITQWTWLPMTTEDIIMLVGTILSQLTVLLQLGALFYVSSKHYLGECPTPLAVAICGIVIALPWTIVITVGVTANLILSSYWETWRKLNKKADICFRLAQEELLKEAKRGKVRAETMGSMEIEVKDFFSETVNEEKSRKSSHSKSRTEKECGKEEEWKRERSPKRHHKRHSKEKKL